MDRQIVDRKACRKLGEQIREIREKIGLNQEQLAFKAKIDRSYLSNVENGHRNLTITVIVRLAKSLKVHPSELLGNQ